MGLNPTLLQLAQHRVWHDAGGRPMEKVAVVPSDPSAGGGAPGGGAPPAGGAPGGMPGMPGGMPMDPSMGMMPGAQMPGMGGMMPGMMGAVDPMTGMPMQQPQQKMKPEQWMQMLDFRLYNMQQQLTALMNAQGVQVPPGALIMPPGSPVSPPAEAAMPGGPQDPTQQQGAAGGGGGGGDSAIAPIEPMQGASPELAAGGGKQAADRNPSFGELLDKMASEPAPPRQSSAPQQIRGAHPGKRPSTQALTAGGSKDPLSRPDVNAPMGPVNKTASQQFAEGIADADVQPRAVSYIGDPFAVMESQPPRNNAAAVAAMFRSRVAAGNQ